MPRYVIEARSFPLLVFWCHNFWVLKDAERGVSMAELHGLAFDPATNTTLPIGYNRTHRLRFFCYAHDEAYAAQVAAPLRTTRMFAKSRAHVAYEGDDALQRWSAAVAAIPYLNGLDVQYPPWGFNVRSSTLNSNSAYRTFGEIMGITVHRFPRAYGPGLTNGICSASEIERLRLSERPECRSP